MSASESKWEKLMLELQAPVRIGPIVSAVADTPAPCEGLLYTGYWLSVSTGEHYLQSPIFRNNEFWQWRRNYLIPADLCSFSFHSSAIDIRGVAYLPLSDVLEMFVFHSTMSAQDCIDLVFDLEPLLCSFGGSPLKNQSSNLLRPELSSLGFVIGPLKSYKSGFTRKFAWTFPNTRSDRSVTRYLSIGHLRFCLRENQILNADLDCVSVHPPIAIKLFELIPPSLRKSPNKWHTQAGIDEICLFSETCNGSVHPRTQARLNRIEFVKGHPELWDNPSKLAKVLKQRGLAKSITAWEARRLIEVAGGIPPPYTF